MLSIGAMSGGAGGYYIGLSHGDYYTEGGEPPGRWIGNGAESLGLRGQIEEFAFREVFDGFSPEGGKLAQNAGRESHRPGWDLTFSAPKSVSVLWSQAEPELRQAIQDAQGKAVEKALEYLEKELAFSRRGSGGYEAEPAGVVAATFEHGTSRAKDPQLHTHALILNVGLREDGSTGTLLSKPFYENKMLLGAIYRAELSHLLEQNLGFFARREERSFEIEGVPMPLCHEFSKRREAIEKVLGETGKEDAISASWAALQTRGAKEQASRQDLFHSWNEEGGHYGFSANEVRHLHRFGQEKSLLQPLERFGETQVQEAVKELTQAQSHFSERDLFKQTLLFAQGTGASAGVVQRQVKQTLATDPDIISLGERRGEKRYTMREILELEKTMLQAVERAQGMKHHTVSERDVNRVIAGKTLSEEQIGALKHITCKEGGVQVVSGMAGTGKTTLLAAAREVWEAEGHTVFGSALAGKAARGLEEGAGIKSDTIAATLIKLDKGWLNFNKKTVFVMDEAGMTDTRSMAKIVSATEKAGAKLILVGDSKQLQPIQLGGAFRAIADITGQAELKGIQRQKEEWARKAVHDLAGGRAEDALKAFAERGRLFLGETREDVREKLLGDWKKEGVQRPEDNLILTSTRSEAKQLNTLAQQERQRGGALSEEGILVNGTRIYEQDRILFTKNNKALDVRNGDFATVTHIHAGLGIVSARLDSGQKVVVPLSDYSEIQLGYAVTTHKAQGVTVENAYVLTGDAMTDKHLSYVQGSRARGETRLYAERSQLADDTARELSRQMNRDNEKELAVTVQQRKHHSDIDR